MGSNRVKKGDKVSDENELKKTKLLYDLYRFDEEEKGGVWIALLVVGALLLMALLFSGLS